jgi:hypothetical protein
MQELVTWGRKAAFRQYRRSRAGLPDLPAADKNGKVRASVDALRNPYRPGAGTTPPALIGRDELIDRFGISLRRAADGRPGQSVMPIGLRGVGKTVLLNRFAEIAQNEGFSVGQLEAPESGEFVLLLSLRIRRILLDLSRRSVSDVVTKALRVRGPSRFSFRMGRLFASTWTP